MEKGFNLQFTRPKLAPKTEQAIRNYMPLFLEYAQKTLDGLIEEALAGKHVVKERLSDFFNCTRQTSRKYGKMIANLAELNIFEQQDEKSIDGFWNHLLRKCRAKQMRRDGADEELVIPKLRHSFSNVTFRYTKPDINYLKAWESKKYPLIKSDIDDMDSKKSNPILD